MVLTLAARFERIAAFPIRSNMFSMTISGKQLHRARNWREGVACAPVSYFGQRKSQNLQPGGAASM
jgi:hypothetical protein